MDLHILPTHLLPAYLEQVPAALQEKFDALHEATTSTDTFSFYTSVSAMASSKIEGEQLEIDSYIKYKMLNVEYIKDLVEKPNDLYNTYLFAQKEELTESNFLQAHKLLAAHLLPTRTRGIYRRGNMVVMEHKTFRIQYEAAWGSHVHSLMAKFWEDVEQLITAELSIEEIFYFASFIHIAFVNIHPFEDGNGRSGRLLEKWFLAQKLGEKAWFLQSEKMYYTQHQTYYTNIRRVGMEYPELDYSKAMPFLLMLPQSLFME